MIDQRPSKLPAIGRSTIHFASALDVGQDGIFMAGQPDRRLTAREEPRSSVRSEARRDQFARLPRPRRRVRDREESAENLACIQRFEG